MNWDLLAIVPFHRVFKNRGYLVLGGRQRLSHAVAGGQSQSRAQSLFPGFTQDHRVHEGFACGFGA